MAIPSVVFKILEKRQGQVIKWWASARREVRAMRDVVPFMVCALDVSPAPAVFAADAEGANRKDHGGYAFVGTSVARAESEAVLEQVYVLDIPPLARMAQLFI